MTTAKDLLDEISAQLHGWANTSDRITPLVSPIGPSDTTFTVGFAFGQSVGISPGLVEVDGEQMWVTSVDATSNTVTVAAGFGRGYGDTTAASHAAGAKIISQPKFPRYWLMKSLNEIIGAVFPDLYTVQRQLATVTWPSNTYTLSITPPQFILDVQWQSPIGNWIRAKSYDLDPYDGTFRLGDNRALVGRPLRILYATEPTTFSSESDDYSVTGLPASCADVLTLGAVARQIPGVDISRAQNISVEQSVRSTVVPPNAGITASQYLMQLYTQRLANEAQSLRKQYKSRTVRVW